MSSTEHMTERWRVVILSNDRWAVGMLDEAIAAAGHTTVGVIMPRPRTLDSWRRNTLGTTVAQAADHLEFCVVPRSSRIAPMLRAYEPDLAVCMYYPWRVPADALAVPRLGVLNGHPSLLPRHRGPQPAAWTLRAGDRRIGVTVHRMDEEFDTGPILVQAAADIPEDLNLGTFQALQQRLAGEAYAEAFVRLAAGYQGRPQPTQGATYAGAFSAEDAWLDLSRPALEVHNLVRGWSFAGRHEGERGPLVMLDGECVRVHATALSEPPNSARRLDCADGPLWITSAEVAKDVQTANGPRQLARAA